MRTRQRWRKTAPKQKSTTKTGGIRAGSQTTPLEAATGSNPQKTTAAGSLRPQDRRTRKAENPTTRPHSRKSVALAASEHSGLHTHSRDALWRGDETEVEEDSPEAEEHDEDRRNPCLIADDSYGGSHWKQPTKDDIGWIFATPGPENQEGGEPNTSATL
ncbi:hypothetical protein NDU88_004783 [Pleurodeles waltl]|uniref:Uncharacterized protein n=1 Tax=Pleurodeles waltl TaxID=8319 RepID=A0AAV7VK54_PLEWA|nr:hypothetical protein NDU88_004783 [Pleurodeles waltl]